MAKVHKLGLCRHFRDLKVPLKLKVHTFKKVLPNMNIIHQFLKFWYERSQAGFKVSGYGFSWYEMYR